MFDTILLAIKISEIIVKKKIISELIIFLVLYRFSLHFIYLNKKNNTHINSTKTIISSNERFISFKKVFANILNSPFIFHKLIII